MRKRNLILLTALTLTTIGLTACNQNRSVAVKNQIKQTSSAATSAEQPISAAQTTAQPVSTAIKQESLPNAQPSGTNQSVNAIGEEKAMAIALEHAKYTQQDLLFSYVRLDWDDGKMNYDVEFLVNDREYDYEIDAISGEILSFDFDVEGNFHANTQAGTTTGQSNATPSSPAVSTQQQASASATNEKTNHKQQTAVSATNNTTNNQSQQSAASVSTTPAPAAPAVSAPAPAVSTPAPADSGVSIDTARQTALSRVPGASGNHIRIHTDYDDGRRVYEGKIIYQAMEYDFEIDAATGNVTDWDVESIYD